jgi:superfamily I DNA and RNA helicase
MARGKAEKNSKFMMTEPLGKRGEKAEGKVWDAVKSIFADRDCIGYWRYPIFSQVGNSRKEPDILIADRELGLIIIEVKSVTIAQIAAIRGHQWQWQNFYTQQSQPYEQAENQLFALLGYCDREPMLRRQVSGRVLVALPLITQQQWQSRGFDQLPSCPPILFQEHLLPSTAILQRIQQTSPVIKGKNLSQEHWQLLLSILGGTPVFRKPVKLAVSQPPPPGSRASILAQVRTNLSELDWQQEQIGKQIPPGPQRIRGIAGSGKTVLLCQKAAHMHLKHPDWEIALVFFSRSLYEPMITQLDKWMRRFSSGEVSYDPKNSKVRSLHAWGAKNQPGLYSQICEAAGVGRLTVEDTNRKQPHESLAEVCRQLLQTTTIPQIFDAILIDEGQDLMVDEDLKFQDKQPFYWMAYQALRPSNPQTPEQRRLIWAYDEAQSLESLNIPTACEVFGEELAHLVTGQYPSGIKKSEIMHRCYRTPSPILTAAHGLSMGLLRPAGMVSGMTRTEDWKAIGYEVTGRFTRGQQVTLRRLPENSPHPIPQLWGKPVFEFDIYRSRQEELTALAANIRHNLQQDQLQPSQEILVVILGSSFEAIRLETSVAQFLMQQGIPIFIPGASECNLLKPDLDHRAPNKFWCEGGVTVSRIHRAKGNEADMVYVVGGDLVAQDESNVSLRNQLFVALTRARGWVKLSGIGKYPFYKEVQRVMESGDTFTFKCDRRPQREISVTDAGEILKRYAAGGRNFQGADLRGIQLAGADLREANLINTQLEGADLRHAQLDGAKLAIADLTQADLSGASLRKAKLMGAILQAANLSNTDLSWADFSDADLSYTKLVAAKLVGANLSAANLSHANLTGAHLESAELSDVSFQEAIMPDGKPFSEKLNSG